MHKGKSLSPFIMVKMSRVAFKLSSPLILLSSGQPTNQKFPSPIGTSRASHSSRFSIPEFRAVGRQLRSYLETGFEEYRFLRVLFSADLFSLDVREADFAILIRNPLSETKKPRASDRETHVAGMHSERGLYACLRKANASTVPKREITSCSRQTVSAQA